MNRVKKLEVRVDHLMGMNAGVVQAVATFAQMLSPERQAVYRDAIAKNAETSSSWAEQVPQHEEGRKAMLSLLLLHLDEQGVDPTAD